jgi:hypothetical protein
MNKNFVHQVGDQPRLYYDARSTKHQDILYEVCSVFLFCLAISRKIPYVRLKLSAVPFRVHYSLITLLSLNSIQSEVLALP